MTILKSNKRSGAGVSCLFQKDVPTMTITNMLPHEVSFRFYYTKKIVQNPFSSKREPVLSVGAEWVNNNNVIPCGLTIRVNRPPDRGILWSRRLVIAFDPYFKQVNPGFVKLNLPDNMYNLDAELSSSTNPFSRDNICRKRMQSFEVTCNNDIVLSTGNLPECNLLPKSEGESEPSRILKLRNTDVDECWNDNYRRPFADQCFANAQQPVPEDRTRTGGQVNRTRTGGQVLTVTKVHNTAAKIKAQKKSNKQIITLLKKSMKAAEKKTRKRVNRLVAAQTKLSKNISTFKAKISSVSFQKQIKKDSPAKKKITRAATKKAAEFDAGLDRLNRCTRLEKERANLLRNEKLTVEQRLTIIRDMEQSIHECSSLFHRLTRGLTVKTLIVILAILAGTYGLSLVPGIITNLSSVLEKLTGLTHALTDGAEVTLGAMSSLANAAGCAAAISTGATFGFGVGAIAGLGICAFNLYRKFL